MKIIDETLAKKRLVIFQKLAEKIKMNYKKKLLNNNIDYFIFGHRHLPLEINLPKKSKYVNLGDWINYNSYASQ